MLPNRIEFIRKIRSPLFWDIFLMYASQASNFLIPLVSLAFLTRYFSKDLWADLLISQSIGLVVASIVEYGHNITATRKLALNQEDLGIIVPTVMLSKVIIIFLVVIPISILYSFFYKKIGVELVVLSIGCGVLQGSLPTWYFQGLNRIRVFALTDLIFRVISAGLTVAVVYFFRQIIIVLSIQFICLIIPWIILNSQILTELRSIKISIEIPKINEVFGDLKAGFSAFLFRFIGLSYTSALAIILAFVINKHDIALLMAGDKILKLLPSLSMPFCQAFYPYMVQSQNTDSLKADARILKYLSISTIVFFSLSALFYIFRKSIINGLLGEEYYRLNDIIGIANWLMPFIALNTIILQLWVFPKGLYGFANLMLIINALISLVWIILAANHFDLNIYLSGIYSGEIIMFLAMFLYFNFANRQPKLGIR